MVNSAPNKKWLRRQLRMRAQHLEPLEVGWALTTEEEEGTEDDSFLIALDSQRNGAARIRASAAAAVLPQGGGDSGARHCIATGMSGSTATAVVETEGPVAVPAEAMPQRLTAANIDDITAGHDFFSRPESETPVTVEAATACLAVMLAVDVVQDHERASAVERLRFIARQPAGRQHVLEAGGIAKLLQLMMDAVTVERTVGVIQNLSFPDATGAGVARGLYDAGVIDRLFWALEFGTATVKAGALTSLFNLSFSISEVCGDICGKQAHTNQLGRCLRHGATGIQNATARLVGAMLLDGSEEAVQRAGQLVTSSVPAGLVDILLGEAVDLTLQLAAKSLTMLLSQDSFAAVHEIIVQTGLPLKLRRRVKANTSLFEQLNLAKKRTTGLVADLEELLGLIQRLYQPGRTNNPYKSRLTTAPTPASSGPLATSEPMPGHGGDVMARKLLQLQEQLEAAHFGNVQLASERDELNSSFQARSEEPADASKGPSPDTDILPNPAHAPMYLVQLDDAGDGDDDDQLWWEDAEEVFKPYNPNGVEDAAAHADASGVVLQKQARSGSERDRPARDVREDHFIGSNMAPLHPSRQHPKRPQLVTPEMPQLPPPLATQAPFAGPALVREPDPTTTKVPGGWQLQDGSPDSGVGDWSPGKMDSPTSSSKAVGKLSIYRASLAEKNLIIGKLEQQVEDLSYELAELAAEALVPMSPVPDLSPVVAERDARIAALERRLQGKANELADMAAKLDGEAGNTEAVKNTIAKYMAQVEALERDITSCTATAAAEHQTVTGEKKALEKSLAQAMAASAAKVKALVKRHEWHLSSSAASAAAKLAKSSSASAAVVADLRRQLGTAKVDIAAERATATARYAELSRQITSSTSKVVQHVDDQRFDRATIAKLERRLVEFQDEVNCASNVRDIEAQSEMERHDQLVQLGRNKDVRIHELEKALQEISVKLRDSEADAEAVRTVKDTTVAMAMVDKEEVTKLTAELALLRNDACTATEQAAQDSAAANAAAERKYSELSRVHSSGNTERHTEQMVHAANIARSDCEIKTLTVAKHRLEAANTEQLAEIMQLQTDLQALQINFKAALHSSNSEIEKLCSANRAVAALKNEALQQNAALEGAFQRLQLAFEARVELAASEAATALSDFSTLLRTKTAADTQLTAVSEERNKLKAELEAVRGAFSAASKLAALEKGQLAELTDVNQEQADDISRLHAEIKVLCDRTVPKLEGVIAQMQAGKASRTEAFRSGVALVARQLQSLKDDHRALRKTVTAEVPPLLKDLPDLGARMIEINERAATFNIQDLMGRYNHEKRERQLLYNCIQEIRGNIRVFCRVRSDPQRDCVMKFPDRRRRNAPCKLVCPSYRTTGNGDRLADKTFEFDRVYSPDDSNQKVYADTEPLIASCVDGYNVSIIAYGQTGSGKTYTMMGTDDNPGVNRMAVRQLTDLCEKREVVDYTMTVSLLEIYNDTIIDLLTDTPVASQRCAIRLDPTTKHARVTNLTCRRVDTIDDVLQCLLDGEKSRKVASTKMNSTSSRSHLVLTVTVRGVDQITREVSEGSLRMVDLAGSERTRKSEAVGNELVEANAINKSLSTLGHVMVSLREGASHIPYRDCKLTHLLKDSIEGDSKVCFFLNISPAESNLIESMNTLAFGTTIRKVEIKSKVLAGKAAAPDKARIGKEAPLNRTAAKKKSAEQIPSTAKRGTAARVRASEPRAIKATRKSTPATPSNAVSALRRPLF